ncbi:sporulation histidine kinase inhibitor Sda [Paenibacillus sp. YN15]|uniref:sporulation histidine kinase inhibitor Sda n=1 Tax=Paenibacillus sp. YN15 TaxID=1742774 RepID=UPI000DCD0570|nr:sporulation histidine kinase inhibitor Sda [Paenibacillus sp. YN15]RAV00596.1 sporulation histidine kinase inhibitor Sda [Paenibacillus sp. YN15]
MRLLSNELLIESYLRALELQLDQEFIELLRAEIQERNLAVPSPHPQAKAN